MLTKG